MVGALDVKYYNPFISSTIKVFGTMAFLKPVRRAIHIKKKGEASFGDISAVIGFAGDFNGALAISFPEDVAVKVVSSMMGEPLKFDDIYTKDGVREFANMIVGDAKATFYELFQLSYNLSIPSLVIGKNHTINYSTKQVVIVVNFNLETLGDFSIEMCIAGNSK